MDNPETLATIGYTRHRTKTNKTKAQHNTENLKTFQLRDFPLSVRNITPTENKKNLYMYKHNFVALKVIVQRYIL
jgi:hypothetical protein